MFVDSSDNDAPTCPLRGQPESDNGSGYYLLIFLIVAIVISVAILFLIIALQCTSAKSFATVQAANLDERKRDLDERKNDLDKRSSDLDARRRIEEWIDSGIDGRIAVILDARLSEMENEMCRIASAVSRLQPESKRPAILPGVYVSRCGDRYHVDKKCNGLRNADQTGLQWKTYCLLCCDVVTH